jgi:putative membrane protein
MDRRSMLVAGGALALSATSVLAQSRGPSPGAVDQPGPAEQKHQQDTMKTGSLSLAASRIAVQKAQNASLKQFAQFEAAEQETVAEVLKSLQGANVTTGQGAATNAEARDQLDEKGKQMIQKLQSAKAGPEFDKEYHQGQVDGHKELLSAQESYIKAGKVREEVNVAKLARGQIKEHLTLLDTISTQLKRG